MATESSFRGDTFQADTFQAGTFTDRSAAGRFGPREEL
jgi:hypothetical protein